MSNTARMAAAAALSFFLAAGSAHAAETRPVDCDIVVDGETYAKGRCAYSPQKGGSFQVSSDNGYFAQVDVTGKNVGEAHWNASPTSTHAHAYLGQVTRKGACWSNKRAKICARALSAEETAAAVATQPAGKMLWPDMASTACIGIEGPVQEGATPVLHNCRIPADLIFHAASSGALSIDKHPGLCIDMEAPGMSKPPQLVLAACGSNPRIWRWQGATARSGIVQSDDGMCWTIPQATRDPSSPFPWPIVVQPCATSAAEAVMLNLSAD